ncbi:MAG: GNAT family N-acetyltransferase, partial [Ktedonobacterales bacterium]|nr:GNAT family N-acetyltransferase [Ktedonobacterales bacterium]
AAFLGVTISEAWWLGPSLLRLLPNLTAAMAHEPTDARWIWLMLEPVTAQVIGDIGFHGPLHADATVEIGYSLVPSARGFGYTTEAATAVVGWAFAHTQIAEIIAQIAPENAASLRVATKLGMHEVPLLSASYRYFSVARGEAAAGTVAS